MANNEKINIRKELKPLADEVNAVALNNWKQNVITQKQLKDWREEVERYIVEAMNLSSASPPDMHKIINKLTQANTIRKLIEQIEKY